MASRPLQLVERATGRLVVESLELADRPWRRLIGWQFRQRPPMGHGLLLTSCRSIHTCWMRFAIDVIAIDRSGRVVEVRRAVRPWRAAILPAGTCAVLEVPSGEAAVAAGDLLAIDAASLPASLRFLS